MSNSKLVLVTGVTGQQGGAVARSLIAKGHRVRGLTRNVESDAAQVVAALGDELDRLGRTWECLLVFDGVRGAAWL